MVLEPCDVLFVKRDKSSSLFGKFIQFGIKRVTHSRYSHVAYYMGDTIAFEADRGRLAGYVDISKYEFDVKRLDFPLDIRQKILIRMVKEQWHSKYDYGEVGALFLRDCLGINIFYDSLKRYLCSEGLYKATYEETGIRIVDQTTGDISPEDLNGSKYLLPVNINA